MAQSFNYWIDLAKSLEKETRSRYPELAIISLLAMSSVAAVVTYGSIANLNGDHTHSIVIGVLLMAVVFLTAGAAGCYAEAIRNDEVGSEKNGIAGPSHITGLGGAVAIFLTILVASIFAIGQWQPYGFDLPQSVGNGTLIVLAGVFGLVFLSSRLPLPHSLDDIADNLRKWTSSASGIGRILSIVDAGLVFAIAPLAGVTLHNPYIRYVVLLGQITSGGLIAWFCPSPLGLIGAFWVFVLVFGVVRRWGWIEHIRAHKHQNPLADDKRRVKDMKR